MSSDVLDRINAKLGALLALEVDRYLRATPGAARPKERPIDEMLAAVGLTTSEIAAVLGKTQRAVQQVLQGAGKKPRKASGRKTSAS